MSALFVRQIPVGPMENFSYLVGPKDGGEVLVVDPAWEPDVIADTAKKEGKRLAGIFLSHHHHDHINGVPKLLEQFDLPVYVQKAEAEFSPDIRAFGDALHPLTAGDVIQVGSASFKALHTPGHTPGSQCLYTGDAVVSGDTVFVGGCGRCDMRGGDPEAMYRSIRNVLLALPANTELLPGHDYGDEKVSTLGREQEKNPYFRLPLLEEFVAYRMRPRR